MALKPVETPLLEITGVLLLLDSLLSSDLIFLDFSRALDTDDNFIHPCNMHLLVPTVYSLL